MKKFFNLRIGVRISIAVLLPMIGLLWFSLTTVRTEWTRVEAMGTLHTMTDVATSYSEVAHELQRERGTSAGFLGSKGAKFGDRLEEQRQLTDQRLDALRLAAAKAATVLRAEGLAAAVVRADRALEQLGAQRQSVSAQSVDVAVAMKYYTETIGQVIDIIGTMAAMSSDRDVSNAISAYVALIKGKERAGQERAVGSAAFAAGKFTLPQYIRFAELGGQQAAYFEQFHSYAVPELVDHFKALMEGTDAVEYARLREIAVKSFETGTMGGVESTVWFDASSARIDALKEVENTVGIHVTHFTNDLSDAARAAFIRVAAFVLVLALLTITIAFVIVRDIVLSLDRMTSAMAALANRDLDITVPGADRHDEIGSMAAAMDIFKQSMVEAERLEEEQERQRSIREAHSRRLEELSARFELTATEVVGKAVGGAAKIGEVAERLGTGVGKTGAHSLDVAEVTERTVGNVSTMASTIDRLSGSINAIIDQVGRSVDVADSAVAEAGRASEIVRGLAEAVRKIGNVLRLITDIAQQTDLLALNATVEAARAGEMGKGFAVVANEVKALANQTAKATDDITNQISNLQDVTGHAVAAIDGITEIINGVSQIASDIAQSVEEQRAATDAITRDTNALASDAASVQESVTTMTQSSAMSHALAVEVIWAASDLGDWLTPFGHEMNWFVKEMKAA